MRLPCDRFHLNLLVTDLRIPSHVSDHEIPIRRNKLTLACHDANDWENCTSGEISRPIRLRDLLPRFTSKRREFEINLLTSKLNELVGR